jgi:hypothetical protein
MRGYYGIETRPEHKSSDMPSETRDKQANPQPRPADSGLRTMMIWVFGALLVTLVAAILVVEFTLRWFGER